MQSAQKLMNTLTKSGFRNITHLYNTGELVYARENHNYPGMYVVVWTSICRHTHTYREKSTDSIKVVVSRGIGTRGYGKKSFRRINRIGQTIDSRVLKRAREAYKAINQWNFS